MDHAYATTMCQLRCSGGCEAVTSKAPASILGGQAGRRVPLQVFEPQRHQRRLQRRRESDIEGLTCILHAYFVGIVNHVVGTWA